MNSESKADMTDTSLRFVRFLSGSQKNPGWWHQDAGDGSTRCGIFLAAHQQAKSVEFSAAAEGNFCIRCFRVH